MKFLILCYVAVSSWRRDERGIWQYKRRILQGESLLMQRKIEKMAKDDKQPF